MQRGIVDLFHVLEFQFFCKRSSRDSFAVYQKNFLRTAFCIHSIFRQEVLSRVTGESADRGDFCPYRIRFTKNLDMFLAVRKTTSQGVWRLPRNNTNGVLRIFNIVFEVMEDTSRF